ncbi:hypothetical protein GGQ67_003261 [Rhizobium metallidurans]|uniref:Uncharacterized protein n=1 Tax=Rhizobium metallidurans TaxID=1265931 RepID=A0A7W6GBE0_9HYPH|nr:hypothetical protein [Rhizobium metallidurans]
MAHRTTFSILALGSRRWASGRTQRFSPLVGEMPGRAERVFLAPTEATP